MNIFYDLTPDQTSHNDLEKYFKNGKAKEDEAIAYFSLALVGIYNAI